MPPKLGTPVLNREISLLTEGSAPGALRRIGVGTPESALFCNVHMLMLSRRDHALADAMQRADWVFADGVPVAWLQSRLTGKRASVVRGYESMRVLCAHAAEVGEGVGLYGARPETLNRLSVRLTERYPGLQIRFSHAPPRVDDNYTERPDLLRKINESGIRWLFVALGCPKQEKWIDRHRDRLDCSLLGVGAAFDWLAGEEPMVPAWMERSGLGWLHRLARHPLRLFGRYAVHNTGFMLLAAREVVLRSRR